MNFRNLIISLLPPKNATLAKRILLGRKPDWEYVSHNWSEAAQHMGKGWNDHSIVEAQKARWPAIVTSIQGTKPLTTAYTFLSPSLTLKSIEAHNVVMCYGYALALAARNKERLRILDWGGGIGHYYLISKALLPQVEIDYAVYDKPPLCHLGKSLQREVSFMTNIEGVLKKEYDLVFSSSSLQYIEKWQEIVNKLASVTKDYFYVSRLPIVHKSKSFVAIQRAYQDKTFGYNAEFIGWFFNRSMFLRCLAKTQMMLVREFLSEGEFFVHNAPEKVETRSFLFKKHH